MEPVEGADAIPRNRWKLVSMRLRSVVRVDGTGLLALPRTKRCLHTV